METKHLQHLFWRAGFGIQPTQIRSLQSLSRKAVVKKLFSDSKRHQDLSIDLSEFSHYNFATILKNPKQLREFIEKSRLKIRDFNVAWVARMATSNFVLRERMTLFWANHFVCKDNNILYVIQYNNTLRKYALGDLKDFTKAISKEPAMLKYLNNKQNVKSSPNENFARELMELFTLGKGHYTESDIKESARAFTGYFHNFEGVFRIRKRMHDYGTKRFINYRGRLNGDDIIDIIFEQKQCAKFICQKIYTYFVNDKLNDEHVNQMVNVLYPKYKIDELMQFVFMQDWFYDDANIGTKIKSPIEFVIGLNNTVPMDFKKPRQLLGIQKVLGQTLLDPPNVAGWKGGRSWIDSNTILFRLRLPSILLNNSQISAKEKGEFNDTMMGMMSSKGKSGSYFEVVSDWSAFREIFKDVPIEELPDHLILTEINQGTQKYLDGLGKVSKRHYCIQLMSLPEYQMC